MAGEVIPGFEIFAEYVDKVKKVDAIEAPVDVEELIMAEEEPTEDVTTPEVKTTNDREEELDLEVYVLNSIMDIFYDDYDVSFTTFLRLMICFILRSMQ